MYRNIKFRFLMGGKESIYFIVKESFIKVYSKLYIKKNEIQHEKFI